MERFFLKKPNIWGFFLKKPNIWGFFSEKCQCLCVFVGYSLRRRLFFLLWCCSVKTVKTVSVNVTYQTVILSKIVYHNLATSEISENRKWKPSLNETFSCDEAFSLKEVRLYKAFIMMDSYSSVVKMMFELQNSWKNLRAKNCDFFYYGPKMVKSSRVSQYHKNTGTP